MPADYPSAVFAPGLVPSGSGLVVRVPAHAALSVVDVPLNYIDIHNLHTKVSEASQKLRSSRKVGLNNIEREKKPTSVWAVSDGVATVGDPPPVRTCRVDEPSSPLKEKNRASSATIIYTSR